MQRMFFIYWQKIKKGRVSGQIATLFILFIAVVFLFTIITINIGMVSGKKAMVDIAAESGTLAMAANLGSWAHYLSVKGVGGQERKCQFAGLSFLAEILIFAIAMATGGWAYLVAQLGSYTAAVILTAIAFTWRAYSHFVLEPAAYRALNRDAKKLSQKQQMSEIGIRTALIQIIDDSRKVPDYMDIDEDNDTHDRISRFAVWYKQRLRSLYYLEQGLSLPTPNPPSDPRIGIIDEFKLKLEDFKAEAGNFLYYLQTDFPVLLQNLEIAGVDVRFWKPPPDEWGLGGWNFDFSSCEGLDEVCGDRCVDKSRSQEEECRNKILGFNQGLFFAIDPFNPPDPTADSVDRTRYILGYKNVTQSSDVPPQIIFNDADIVNPRGVMPIINDFLAQNTATLVDTFDSWKGDFYYASNPTLRGAIILDIDPNTSDGGIYEDLGNGYPEDGLPIFYPKGDYPPGGRTNNSSLWDELGYWYEELVKIKTTYPDIYNANLTAFEDALNRIYHFKYNVDGDNGLGVGGIRGDIYNFIQDFEFEAESSVPADDSIKREAIYSWKNNLGWHFVYAQVSNFNIPWLKTYTRTHILHKTRCVAVQYPYNNNSEHWKGNRVELTLMRYDQESQSVNLFGKNPSTGNYLFSWNFIFRKNPTTVIDEPSEVELDAADSNGDGLLTEDEIKNAGLGDRIETLLKDYSIQRRYAKGAYNFKGNAKLVDCYEWERKADGSCPVPPDVQINLF